MIISFFIIPPKNLWGEFGVPPSGGSVWSSAFGGCLFGAPPSVGSDWKYRITACRRNSKKISNRIGGPVAFPMLQYEHSDWRLMSRSRTGNITVDGQPHKKAGALTRLSYPIVFQTSFF